MKRVLFVVGTRPEAIKMSPIWREVGRRPEVVAGALCATGQHRELVRPFLALFGMEPTFDLDVMVPGQSLSGVAARVLEAMDALLVRDRPDLVLVQGDTTSALAAALAAFHRGIEVGHVEAGLRTGDLTHPFPEEMNRVVISRVASWHFAPTAGAGEHLRREGVAADRVLVTGNTVVDALLWAREHLLPAVDVAARFPWLDRTRRLVLVTGHRRESFGGGIESVCLALRDLVERHPDVQVAWPVHLNPQVQAPVLRLLGPAAESGTVHLEPPLGYVDFLALLEASFLVVTDSGGIQEEAPSFRKPVLVTRPATERPEGVEAGVARLVGTDRARIVAAADELLDNPAAYARMTALANPYGDGRAAERIVDAILRGG